MSGHYIDPVNRRGFLECMGWAGTGALFTISGGIATSMSLDAALAAPAKFLLKYFFSDALSIS